MSLRALGTIWRHLVVAGLYLVAVAASAESLGQGTESDRQRRMLHLWEDRFWVPDAEPMGLNRHRTIISNLKTGVSSTDSGIFAVEGHQLVRGTGVVLVIQRFTRDPFPEQHVILQSGEEISRSRFWKLLIYLPDGLPDDGEVKDIGFQNNNGAFAMLTRGTLTNLRRTCFAYADRGSITAVSTKKPNGKITVIDIGDDVTSQDIDIDSLPKFSSYNVIIDVDLEFRIQNSINDGSLNCSIFSPLREGVLNRVWFSRRTIEDLPWNGNVTGPLNASPR